MEFTKQIEKDLIAKSFKFAGKYHLEQDELLSQCYLLFVELQNDYDPARSGFRTYINRMMEHKLHDYCKREYVQRFQIEYDFDESYIPDFVLTREFMDEISSFTKRTQKLIDIIIHDPDLHLDFVTAPKKLRGQIFRYIKQKYEWTEAHIWQSFAEIKEAFA